ncbi:MAG: DUF3034 family protein [Gammaproteobacteria bacterium]|nr:DUF3034 family protein [Gammaproteobacteria bacterium]
MKKTWLLFLCSALTSLSVCAAEEANQTNLFGSGKLNLTGLIPNIDGAAGGGITHSAIIGGYGTEDQVGAAFNYSQTSLSDFELKTTAVSVGLFNRVELSFSESEFDTQKVGAALGLGENYTFENTSINLKVNIFGDAILEQDTWLPQVSIGASKKESDNANVLALIGATKSEDTETFIAASKLFLDHSFLVNVSARNTRANQNGILGFGGDQNSKKKWYLEGSLAYLLADNLAVGIEMKQNPDNLGFARQDHWRDIFLLYNPSKHVSLTVAYVDLGEVALQEDQSGLYTSLTLQF